MMTFRRLFALLLCSSLLTAGCGKGKQPGSADVQRANDDVRSTIKKTVHDKARQAQLEALVDQACRRAAELNKLSRREVKELAELNRNYDATPQDFEKITTKFLQDRKTIYQFLLDVLLNMRSLADKNEWKAIIKKEKKALAMQLRVKE